jgi:hypothetical protein
MFLIVVVALLVVVAVTPSGASGSYTLAPDVMASGGQASSSASYSLVSTLGQPMVGAGSSASYAACSSYWCQIPPIYKVLLPVVSKNS